MRTKLGLRITARLAFAVLVSCNALNGIDKLTIDDDGVTTGLPDAAGGDPLDRGTVGGDSSTTETGTTDDGSTGNDGGGDASTACNEPGLVAYWRMDEGSGLDVTDCSPNKLDGKMEAGTWVQGKKGMALSFNGGWAGFGSPMLLNKTGAFTVMAWVRSENADAGTGSRYIVGKTQSAGNNGWRLATQASQYAVSISGPDAGLSPQTFGGAVVIGQWSHVTTVYIPNTAVEIYVDGQLLTRNVLAKTTSLLTTTDEFRIGTKGDGTFPFLGTIDDVRLYDRALSAAEIAARAAP